MSVPAPAGAPPRGAAASIASIALAEFRLQTRRFAFWVFAIVFVVVGIFYFTRYVSVSPGEDSLTQSVKLARNCAYSLSVMLGLLPLVFCHLTAALSMDPVLRDRRIGVLPMILSSPLREEHYVLGKFLGVVAASLAAPLFFVAAAAIGQFVPNASIGLLPPNAAGLTIAYLEFCVPVTLIVSALSFAVATRTGNTKLVYSLVTVFMMAYLIILNAVSSIEKRWTAYLDPTGLLWLGEVIGKGKTNAEMNAFLWMMDTGFLVNRLVLLAGAIVPVYLVAREFARREAMAGTGARAAKRASRAAAAAAPARGAAAGSLRPLPEHVRLLTGGIRQFGRVLATEFRLLLHERALFFLPLVLVLLILTSFGATSGPFESEMIPVTSQVVRETYGTLLLFLFGTTVFFAGESAFRERETGLADMLHACPVPEAALVFGKAVANVVVSIAFVLVALVTVSIYQGVKGGGAIDPRAFVAYYVVLLLPTILLMTAVALFVASLARNKQLAYAVLLALGGGMVWAFVRGHRHWLYNMPAVSLTSYSDIVGFGPLATILYTQRVYVCAIALLLLLGAAGLYPRAVTETRRAPSLAAWGRRRVLVPAALALCAALALGVRIHTWVEGGSLGSLAAERMQVRYEKVVKPWLNGRPEPEVAGVDLDLDLYPERNAFRVAGAMRLRNPHAAPLDSVHLTVNPRLLRDGEILLAGKRPDRFEDAVATFALAEPLAPGAEAPLVFRWEGRVPDGPPRHSGGLQTWIQPGATFLHSFDAAAHAWLPTIGYSADLEIGNDRTRRKHHLGKRETLPDDDGVGQTPGFGRQTSAFPYHAVIRAPQGERILSAGRLVAERDLGDRREYEFASDGLIYFYPVMAGRWIEKRDESTAVYHAAEHPQNAEKILDALAKSRAFYSEAFTPFPYADLRIAEFPRHGQFAMGYPTLIPFSESIGFLTKDPKNLPNLNFYVTAHEVAHQWWGTVVWPAHAKGSPVLTEGLANYASLLAAERFEGDAKRRRLFEQYEDRYLRQRDPNEERPLMLVDGDRRGDQAIMYSRGGVVFYMLHRMLGEERMLAAIREYVRRYSFQQDHPTMTDAAALFEELYPETHGFIEQFVRGMAIPNPGFTKAEREELPDGRWRVTFEIANRAEGDLDLVVEAHEGTRAEQEKRERKAREGGAEGEHGDSAVGTAVAAEGGGAAAAAGGEHGSPPDSGAKAIGASARAVVTIAGKAPASGEIICDFKPDEIEIDPEATVLMQERRKGRRAL